MNIAKALRKEFNELTSTEKKSIKKVLREYVLEQHRYIEESNIFEMNIELYDNQNGAIAADINISYINNIKGYIHANRLTLEINDITQAYKGYYEIADVTEEILAAQNTSSEIKKRIIWQR